MNKLTEQERDQYFREALHSITGVDCPTTILYDPITWGDLDVWERLSTQDWASYHAKPHWACGISILEAAKNFVDDAEANVNIGPDAG